MWEVCSWHAASIDAKRLKALSDRFDLLLEQDPFGSRYHDMAVRSLAAEVAAAGHISSGVAEGMLHHAHTIVHRYPALLTVMEQGAITLRHAEAISSAGTALDDSSEEDRAEYTKRALEVALTESARRTEATAKMIDRRPASPSCDCCGAVMTAPADYCGAVTKSMSSSTRPRSDGSRSR